MSTDQAPAREVDDVLASIDDVLAESTAPSETPAAAVVDPVGPVVEPVDAVAAYIATVPAAPAVTGRPESAPWWDRVYGDDRAWEDTYSGADRTAPAAPAVPPPPAYAPHIPAPAAAPEAIRVTKDNDPEDAEDQDREDGDEEGEDEEPAEAPAPRPTPAARVRQVVFAPAVPKAKDGPFLTYRGRQVLYATTAALAGWQLGLYGVVDAGLDRVAQDLTDAGALVFGAGVLALATRTRLGCLLCAGAVGLVGALYTFPGAAGYAVGGALAFATQGAYRMVRARLGDQARRLPWGPVAWAAHIPAATTTLAAVMHGAN